MSYSIMYVVSKSQHSKMVENTSSFRPLETTHMCMLTTVHMCPVWTPHVNWGHTRTVKVDTAKPRDG